MSVFSHGRSASWTHGILAAALLIASSACARTPQTPLVNVAPVPAPPVEMATVNARQNETPIVQQGAPARADIVVESIRAVAPKPAEVEAPATPLPALPAWDIDVHSYAATTRVAYYVSRFTGRSREYIQSRLSEGTRYEAMIRSAMRNGGIPEDMYYLALVESGYDPNAYSRAAAVGMWQFMSSTARGMGLRVDWWVDERRDPIRSTHAAVRFLGGLREQFGSIYLAAAAYNGGPGRIARGLTRYADDLDGTEGDDLFFALADTRYLRNETREYVPQLIAAALIAKEPERHGIQIEPRPVFTYDSVTVPALTSLASVAAAAGVSVKAVRELNPQILRGMAPPKAAVMLRIPAGSAARFDSAFSEIPDSLRVGARVVRTKGGETPAKLAKLTGISPTHIGRINKSLKRGKSGAYLAGQNIYIPTPAAVAAATSVPDPSIERYGGLSSSGTHRVRKGETLGGIAKRYRTTTAALMRVNGLKKSLIFPGQEILISGKARTKTSRKG